jgi:hypothetical protein
LLTIHDEVVADMNIWYPRFPLRQLPTMIGTALLGAAVAGCYGALHDQISYTICPEYFTRFKFYQFSYANFDWPKRVFVSEVGFLASWWVGLVAGWLAARAGLAALPKTVRTKHIRRTFALVIGITAICGATGALLETMMTQDGDLSSWQRWHDYHGVQDLRGFAIVAWLHAAGYIGAFLGLVSAIVYVRIIVAKEKRMAAEGQKQS